MKNKKIIIAIAVIVIIFIVIPQVKATASISPLNHMAKNSPQRNLRNLNPGNLKLTNETWLGKIPNSQNSDGVFEQFKNLDYGARAMLILIRNKITKKGLNTLNGLGLNWADNEISYPVKLSQLTGIYQYSPISANRETITTIGEAIAKLEGDKNGIITKNYLQNVYDKFNI